ncbi:MAG: hypothetical protein QOI78_4761 [Actinomycetota bacterium]|jgi:hypothetical protein|nr:hypothetical protein [Actinomycetota bacterium]
MTAWTLAADAPASPAAYVLGFIVIGGLVAGGLAMTIIRIVRSRKPRDKQMALLAAQLDGRDQVCVRVIEIGLTREDLLRVAHSRGYALIEHRVTKYYEFVRASHRVPPGQWPT